MSNYFVLPLPDNPGPVRISRAREGDVVILGALSDAHQVLSRLIDWTLSMKAANPGAKSVMMRWREMSNPEGIIIEGSKAGVDRMESLLERYAADLNMALRAAAE